MEGTGETNHLVNNRASHVLRNRSVGNRAALLSYGKAPQRMTFVITFDLRRVSGGRYSYIRCFLGPFSLNA